MKTIDIIIPVYYGNADELEQSLKTQIDYYEKGLREYAWHIVVAINGPLTQSLMGKIKLITGLSGHVRYEHIPTAGKGAGIIDAWQQSQADIRVYMDVDLATDLHSLKELVTPLEEDYDICVGSRYHRDSKVFRSWRRRTISKIYHRFFLNFILGVKFTDGQCGFKAVTARVVREILPEVQDKGWFFESEMLFLAERAGFKIKEIPVTWKETARSSVNLVTTIPSFVLGVFRLLISKYLWSHKK